MKIKKKILYIITFLLFFICIGTNQSKAGNLKLNNLDFQAQINADGSMDVTEIWDINIKSTNTLYKTFKTDNSKYSGITNTTVTDITNGIQNNFTDLISRVTGLSIAEINKLKAAPNAN